MLLEFTRVNRPRDRATAARKSAASWEVMPTSARSLDFMSRAVSQSISFCDRRGARWPRPTLPNKAARCWVWAIASLGVLCQALGCVASSRWELSGEEFSTETIWLL